MIWRGIGTGLAGAGLMLAAPVQAQQAVNTVSCAYDGMGREDREIALLLIAREFAQGGKFDLSSRNVTAVNELIAAAQQTCRKRFGWTARQSDAATNYALTAILGDALDQSLQAGGRSIAPLEQYYRENEAARRSGKAGPGARLGSYLSANGWDGASEPELSLARLYIEILIGKDLARREFALR